PVLDIAGRTAATTRIHAHADIAVRHPLLGIADFPALILVGRARRHARMLFHHALPGSLVTVLEVQPLAIGAAAEDDGIAAFADWSEDVAAQHQAVVHRDRHVPIDLHPIAYLADLTVTHSVLLRKISNIGCVSGSPYFLGITGSSTCAARSGPACSVT